MLPRNEVPNYTLSLQSDNKVTIKYRPFLVREEKIMLMAAQSRDETEIKSAINQILTNCVLEPKDFNPDELAMFDVEWILINLRIKSVGSKIESEYYCNNVVNDIPCHEPFKVEINLDDIKLDGNPKPNNKISLSDKLGVLMRPPRFKIIKDVSPEVLTNDYDFTILSDAVVSIFDEKQQYQLKDQTPEEIKEWFESLTKEQFTKIRNYLVSLPVYKVHKEHKCIKCGFEHKIDVDNLASFF